MFRYFQRKVNCACVLRRHRDVHVYVKVKVPVKKESIRKLQVFRSIEGARCTDRSLGSDRDQEETTKATKRQPCVALL
ncbi:hypothetical protein E2C01_035433 [Portunus trituberculatus]|uniref:Uncharacterized protein n=1 Tax=Portunus trituberculatus TaxID=210409 RepID=A0A5B7F955_PORTR|nr:hypothetical protein [Portunus trituberculatus]